MVITRAMARNNYIHIDEGDIPPRRRGGVRGQSRFNQSVQDFCGLVVIMILIGYFIMISYMVYVMLPEIFQKTISDYVRMWGVLVNHLSYSLHYWFIIGMTQYNLVSLTIFFITLIIIALLD